MTVQPDDVLKVTFEVELHDGTIAQNVHYFHAILIAPMTDAQALIGIELWVEDAYNQLSGSLPASMTQRLCTVQTIDWNAGESKWEVTGLIGYFTPTISFVNASDELPNQSSAFATFNTTRPKSRGRKFAMPFGEDTQDGTYLTAAALSDMTDWADEILDNVVFGALEYFVPGIPREAVDVWLDFVGAVVTNVLGSQRRRRPGVGA